MSKSTSRNADKFRKNAKQAEEPAAGAGLRWDDLALVLALSRAGTLSGAAARLGVNTSTVARRLDALEEGLGIHLFDRTSAGIAATELAEELAPIAEAMERAAADALRLVEGRETAPEGIVRLTAPPGLANWFVAPALPKLRARYPKIAVELDASIGYADLTRREADLALRSGRPRSGDLVAVRLCQAGYVIAAGPSRVAELGALRSLDACEWITWGRDLAHLPDAAWVAANVAPARVALRTSSMDAQLHAAREGLGALLVPEPFVAWSGLAPVRLARALASQLTSPPAGELWLIGHRALRSVPRIQAVWEFILEESQRWV
ncbi:MAG: LysR family transcriptional regulator [Myxococcales bacterium]|nr:LysR family transcriptional regulator [Myxococcales bacterium]